MANGAVGIEEAAAAGRTRRRVVVVGGGFAGIITTFKLEFTKSMLIETCDCKSGRNHIRIFVLFEIADTAHFLFLIFFSHGRNQFVSLFNQNLPNFPSQIYQSSLCAGDMKMMKIMMMPRMNNTET